MNGKTCIITMVVVFVSAAASSDDPSVKFTEPLLDLEAAANNTEDDNATTSSGDSDCTCNDITCSNCGVVHDHSNLFNNATAIRLLELVESNNKQGKKYLEVYFCQLIGLRRLIYSIDLKYSSVLCRIGEVTYLDSKIVAIEGDVACWQYTVLNAYYYELQRQYQYDHYAVPRAKLNSVYAHIKASTKALQRIKLGFGSLCPVYQPNDYLNVYASLVVMHGDDVIECVLRSLVFDAHKFLEGVAYLERKLDPTLSGFMCDNL